MFRYIIYTVLASPLFFACSVDVQPPEVQVGGDRTPSNDDTTPEKGRTPETATPSIRRPVERSQPPADDPPMIAGCRSFATEFIGSKEASFDCQGNCVAASTHSERDVDGRCIFENLELKCSISEIFPNGIRLTRERVDIYPSISAFVAAAERIVTPVARSVTAERFDSDSLHSEEITSRIMDEAGRVQSSSTSIFSPASSVVIRRDLSFTGHDLLGNPVAGERRHFIDDPQDAGTEGFSERLCRREGFSASFAGNIYEEVYVQDRDPDSGCFTESRLVRSLSHDEHGIVTEDHSVRQSTLRFSDQSFNNDKVFDTALDYQILSYESVCINEAS